MWQVVIKYFALNRKEQRGLFVLIFLLFGLLLARFFVSRSQTDKPMDMSTYSKEIEQFIASVQAADSMEHLDKGYKFRNFQGSSFDSSKRWPKPLDDAFIIELNAADTLDLQRLRGIGSRFAKRIVNYRQRLGGFIDKNQVLEVFGMDTSRYNKIKDHLTVNPDSLRRIDINLVTFKELLWHPYFPFVVSKAIMTYRMKVKKIEAVEQLKRIEVINDSIYKKIAPYILVK
jgi:competence ComEA-like helix-hairpin-helix protein